MYNMRGVWGVGCEYKLLVKEGGSGVSCILTSPLLLCFNRIIQFCLFQELLFFFSSWGCLECFPGAQFYYRALLHRFQRKGPDLDKKIINIALVIQNVV